MIMTILLVGCTNQQPTILPQAELHAQYQYKGDWSVQLGCYYSVSGYAYNSGSAAANNAILYLTITDTGTGSIRDSKTIVLGYINKGDSKTFDTTLDSDCGHNYRVDASFGS